ncbi:MAG: hypothetical protein ACR2OJ_02450 [Hyphomicrobiales bacterium]
MNQYSLIGAFAGLVIGFLDVAFASRFLYPSLRMRYERAKAYGKRTIAPSTIMGCVQIIGYIILPIAGYVVANLMFKPGVS